MGILRSALGRSMFIVALLSMCVFGAHATGMFSDALPRSVVPENLERNQIATTLYAKIATLPQPVTVSEVARLLNVFTQNEPEVAGATLVDTQGQLMVQIGSGNETLALGTRPTQSGYVTTAKIPITSEGQPFANAVITFRNSSDSASPAWPLLLLTGIVIIMMLAFAYIELRRYQPFNSPAPQ